mgnify:CR=1 FL=1
MADAVDEHEEILHALQARWIRILEILHDPQPAALVVTRLPAG